LFLYGGIIFENLRRFKSKTNSSKTPIPFSKKNPYLCLHRGQYSVMSQKEVIQYYESIAGDYDEGGSA